MAEQELRKRIEWIDWILKDANTLCLTADTIEDQKQRRATLQAELTKLTTCWCGKGKHYIEKNSGGTAELVWCDCNQKEFIKTLTR